MEDEEFGEVSEGSDDGAVWTDCGGGEGNEEAARFARLQHEISRLNQLMYAAEDRTAHCSHLYERFTSEMRGSTTSTVSPAPPPDLKYENAPVPSTPPLPSTRTVTPESSPVPPPTPAIACSQKCDIPQLDRAFLLWRRLERMRLCVSALRLQIKQRQLDTLMQVNEFLIGAESGQVAAAAARSDTCVGQDIAMNSFKVALLECSLLSSTASSLAASVRAQQQVPEKVGIIGDGIWTFDNSKSWTTSGEDQSLEIVCKTSGSVCGTTDRATSPRTNHGIVSSHIVNDRLSKRPFFNWPASRPVRSTMDLASTNAGTARLCHSDSVVA